MDITGARWRLDRAEGHASVTLKGHFLNHARFNYPLTVRELKRVDLSLSLPFLTTSSCLIVNLGNRDDESV
jgi:hypothetical protein